MKGNSQGGMLVFNQNLHSLQVLLDLREVVAFVLKKKGTNLVIQGDFFSLLGRSGGLKVGGCEGAGHEGYASMCRVKHVHCSTKHFILLFKI